MGASRPLPGKTIGEMSLIGGEPRSASAVTGSEATLFVMTAEQFEGLNQALPGIGITLALKIAKQMSQYLRQTGGRLIDHLEVESRNPERSPFRPRPQPL